MDAGLEEELKALRKERAYLRPAARVVAVAGADAGRWLNDLVTAGVEAIADGEGTRSLILSPTGRIRADLHVVRSGERFLLVQALDQPEAVEAILAPYVLSSAVEIEPSKDSPVLVPSGGVWLARLHPPDGALEVGGMAAELWRVGSGIAAFPADLDRESLPAEAGLDVPPVTDTAKGCFLGQESVARVRNLGHPTRLVLPFAADGPVRAGDRVLDSDLEAGVVTSAARAPNAPTTAVLARVRWEARKGLLRTSGGARLAPR